MKSTGEVMGGATTFGAAFAKAQIAVGQQLPESGTRVHQREQRRQADRAADRARPGRRSASRSSATRGTAAYLRAHGLEVDVVYKVNEGRPNVADEIVNGKIDLVINTPLGRESFFDDRAVRRVAMMHERAVHHHADRRVGGGRGDPRAAHRRRSTSARCRTTTRRRRNLQARKAERGIPGLTPNSAFGARK